jgi:hypothetical protein
MLKFIGVVAAMLAFTTAGGANAESFKAKAVCFKNCQTELKSAGTWNSLPKGYCRRRCDYWIGAPPDVRR